MFFVWRLLGFLIAFLAQFFVHSSGNNQFRFGYGENILHIPDFMLTSANFDGYNYLHIAQNGYGNSEQAFFPLFPLLIHILSIIFAGNYVLSGLIISNICFFVGLLFFKKYLQLLGKKPQQIIWIFLFLLTFPTAFFFGAVYTESLFFLLVTGTLYFAEKKKTSKLIVFAVLASLTRLMGIFLVLPLFTLFLEQNKLHLSQTLLFIRKHTKFFFVTVSPFVGLLLYMIYLQFTQKDALLFYHAQSNFNSGRSSHSIILLPQVYYRYFNIFLHAQHNLVYFVSVVECATFSLVFCVLLYDLWMLWKKREQTNNLSLIGLNIFSLINIVLPTLTGTFLSVPRFSLLSLSFFIRLGAIQNKMIKIGLLILFAVLQIILLSLFSQGYFIS